MTSSNGDISALLAICAGNLPVPDELPAQRPVTRSFDVFFDLRLHKRLSKQSWDWWFETPSRSLWCHRHVMPWLFALLGHKQLWHRFDNRSIHGFSFSTGKAALKLTLCRQNISWNHINWMVGLAWQTYKSKLIVAIDVCHKFIFSNYTSIYKYIY